MRLIMSAQDARGPMILIWQGYASDQQILAQESARSNALQASSA